MTDNFIQLKKSDTSKLEIVDADGKATGNFLEFDMEDIELPIKYQELIEKDKKNQQNLRNKLLIIEKQQDHKGKKLYSSNEEAEWRALQDFFIKEEEIYNEFLGENGVKKLLNGRKLGWTSLSEIDEIIEKQIFPCIEKNMDNIIDKIKNKYKQALESQKNVLK